MVYPLISFLLVVLFSIIVVRVGTIALMLTGLSRDVASFQAQSAFSGVGFTTSEAEHVVGHPVRRRIIRILMLLGSAGLTSAMATLVLTFVGQPAAAAAERLVIMALGLLALYAFARSRWVDRWLSRVITWALERFTNLRVIDYERILGIGKGYGIGQFRVHPNSWLEGRTLGELRLYDEGILVLAIYRGVNGREIFIGAPRRDTRIEAGDLLIVYGPEDAISKLARRIKGPIGDLEHEAEVNRERLRRIETERALRQAASAASA